MSHEPSNGELARRLDTIQGLVQGLIGRQEYLADQRATDRRIGVIEADVQRLDKELAETTRGLHDRIDEQAKSGVEHRRHWQELLFIGLLPSVVTALGILLTIWMNGGKH